MSEQTRYTVAVLVFYGVELVDMNGPVDVFLHANNYDPRRPYDVVTMGVTREAVLAEGRAVGLVPTCSLADRLDPDIIVVPGRIPAGTTAGPELTEWLVSMCARGKTVLSVCVGFYTLAEAGLLDGRRATTHYQAIDYVEERYPAVRIVKNVRYVEDGQFVTTGGITSGIDGALALVTRYSGADVAQKVADVMVYDRTAPLPPSTILPLAVQAA
jgi:transcriptional regulator GlxA family with amidase domain